MVAHLYIPGRINIYVNPEILAYFKRIIANERLAHAYLFNGPEGSGKSEAAFALAKMLNCEHPGGEPFCGKCGSCTKIASGNHPDIYLLKAALGETIPIDDIRALIQRSGLRPFEAKCKVFLIQNADRLKKEAANALLKTLEEPNRQTLMILTTCAPELCLDTIKSRCQIVYFYPSSLASVAKDLKSEFALDDPLAQTLAYFSEGSLTKAKSLFEEKFSAQKNKIIDEIIMKRHSEEFLRKMLSDKEDTLRTLKVLLSFFRDMMLVKSGVGKEGLANRDRERDVRSLAAEFSFEEVERVLGQIVKAMQLFKDNLNVKMSMGIIKEMVFK